MYSPNSRDLTEREKEVLALVIKGQSSKDIARELGISSKTADEHRARCRQKLYARNLADLVRLGWERRCELLEKENDGLRKMLNSIRSSYE